MRALAVFVLLAVAPAAAQDAPASSAEAFEDDGLSALRDIESRLAVGHPLTDAERALLVRTAVDGGSAEERALAAAILPWLPPALATPVLLRAVQDEDARVRAQGVHGLFAVGPRLDAGGQARVLKVGVALLDDGDDEVACASARMLAVLAPPLAAAEVRRRAADTSTTRHECWRRLVPLEARAVEVAPPPLPILAEPELPVDEAPPEVAPPPAAPPNGDWLFVATAASAGFLVGGALPGVFLPPRDTLTYRERRTIYAREEPSIVFASAGALLSGAALGGAAFGITQLVGPLEIPAATSIVLGTSSATLAGLGAGVALGLSPNETTGVGALGAGAGLLLTSALAYTLPPNPSGIGLSVALGGQAALAGTLLSLAIVPVGTPTLFDDRVLREDFALGTGLLAGGAVTTLALVAAPFVDPSPSRTLIASAAGLSAGAMGLGLVYLFTPATVDIRERIASGVGVGLQLVTFPLVFALLPGEWVASLDGVVSEEPTALVIDDEGLKLGLPSLTPIVSPDGQRGLAVGLLSGRF